MVRRLLDFWVALAALAGMMLTGAAAIAAAQAGAWASAALFAQPAVACLLVVVVNILAEIATAVLNLLAALAAPLLAIPPVRRRVRRARLRRNASRGQLVGGRWEA